MESKQISVAELQAIIEQRDETIAELTAQIEQLTRPGSNAVPVAGAWVIEHETAEGKTKSHVRIADGMTHLNIGFGDFPRGVVPMTQVFDLAVGKKPANLDDNLTWCLDEKGKPNGQALEVVRYLLDIGAGYLIVDPA